MLISGSKLFLRHCFFGAKIIQSISACAAHISNRRIHANSTMGGGDDMFPGRDALVPGTRNVEWHPLSYSGMSLFATGFKS